MDNEKTIAIIGNGFDLAHGYKTRYKDFAENTKSKALDIFRCFCDENSIVEWYDFEKNIESLTMKYFLASMDDSEDYSANRRELSALTGAFNEIHSLLEEYLKNEIARKPLKKQTVIEKYLSPHTLSINFNYTPTVEHYTDNVFYIHGSIKEHDIILGYDYRDEPCLIGYDEMQWSKQLCRDALEFRRCLKNEYNFKSNDEEFCRYNDGFIAYQSASNSNRGLDPDTEPKQYLPEYQFITKYLGSKKCDIIDIIRGKSIETAVIIGHGIKADKELLRTIFTNLTSLKKIVIFSRKNESPGRYEEKEEFFKQFCNNIVPEQYETF